MKRFFALLLVCAMLLTLAPTVFAVQVASGTSGDVSWTLSDDGTLTFSGEGAMADYTSTYDTPWKTYASQIKKIVFADGVTHIGSYAFYDYSTVDYAVLASVEMHDVVSIGTYAFRYCDALASVDFGTKLETVGEAAFAYCSALGNVTFPDTLKTLDTQAFRTCSAMTELVLPDSVESIGNMAFYACEGLTDVTVGSHVSSIGSNAFKYITGTVHCEENSNAYMYSLLNGLKVEVTGKAETVYLYDQGTADGLTWIFYADGTLKITGEGAMPDYTSETYNTAPWIAYARQTRRVIVDEGVTYVGAYTFYNNSNTYYPQLTEVTVLGNAVIGEAAFKYGKETSIIFEGEGGSIGKEAFAENASLKEFVLPEGITEIGEAAFRRCKSLTEIEFPDSVTEIGANAFYNCEGLKTLYFDGEAPAIGSNAFYAVSATAYYHKGMESWTEDKLVGYGGRITWVSFTYDAVVTEPTCADDGFTTYNCTHCDFSYTDDYTDALGHDYVAAVTAPTCTAEGYTTYTCSRCEDSYTEDYTEMLPHECEAIVTEPTCTEQGYTTHACKNCDYSYVDTYVDELGHDYVGIVTEPTCTEKGYTTYTCTRCEDTYTGDETDALGHTEVIDEAVEPTCTEPGLSEGSHCAVCGETLVAQEVIPASDHDYIAAETTAPTCTKDGSVTYTCTCCGETYTEVLPAVECPTKDYKDVPNTSNWGHAGIDFCVERGIMGSTTTDDLIFEPGTVCTRAMIVSILYRLSGSPEVEYEAAFPDVPDGQWYSKAVIWGYQHGVVKGYDTGKFGPNDKITREQMAVILKGYTENVVGKDTSASASLESFYDAKKVTWSKSYVEWAVAVGMISGKIQSDGKTMLDPQGNATRAEVASILMRYIQNILE